MAHSIFTAQFNKEVQKGTHVYTTRGENEKVNIPYVKAIEWFEGHNDLINERTAVAEYIADNSKTMLHATDGSVITINVPVAAVARLTDDILKGLQPGLIDLTDKGQEALKRKYSTPTLAA